MSKADYVFEVLMEEWPEWPGNELYADFGYAKFCAEQDYKEAFPQFFLSEESNNTRINWDFLCKGFYQMLENDVPTGVTMRVRHVHSLGE